MKKIILSRKGYDDKYGGKSSIIFPDLTMLSFPIPIEEKSKEKGERSGTLKFKDKTLSDYFMQLGHKIADYKHHVDPDIYGLSGSTTKGAFGQGGAALSHLKNEGVGEGDVFLFFGTFCHTFDIDGKLQYEPMHSFHAIYGYLVVDNVVTTDMIDNNSRYDWLKPHPHYQNKDNGGYAINNAIYIGNDFGYFQYSPVLQLTKSGYNKSYWKLPGEFEGVKFTYHDSSQQRKVNSQIEFASASIGQEFVTDRVEKLEDWLSEVLNHKVAH